MSPMRKMSSGAIAAGAALVALAFLAAAEVMVVEDWSRQPAAARGVPEGWTRYETIGGRPASDFTVTEDAGRKALLLKSPNDHTTIALEVLVGPQATAMRDVTWEMVKLRTRGVIA